MPDNASRLKWYLQMGVNEVTGSKPVNRFEQLTPETPAAKPVVQNPALLKANPVAAVIPEPALMLGNPAATEQNTRNLADSCSDLGTLRNAVCNFKELSIARTATNTVFSDGNPDAKIMFIGEAPGAEEDARGIPFCGASGQLLDQMLSFVGLIRSRNFYISNTVFWRPPGNRRPTPEELAICRPLVEKHIALVKPELIILVGGTAIESLLKTNIGITKMRGSFYDYTNTYLNKAIPATAIFHPSYLLRSPGQKRFAWSDLLMLKEYISKNSITM